MAAGIFVHAADAARLKDVATISGVRDNQLVGYGLVVGLNGSGDKSGSMVQALSNMLLRMGLNVPASQLKPKNVAAVIVTAKMPTFAKPGTRLDILVSSMGDAKSLQGGTLLRTPLLGPDGEVYALGQGALSIGGFSAGGGGTGTTKNHPTAGRVPGGAVVEREVPFTFADRSAVEVNFHSYDFTTVARGLRQINTALGGAYARAEGPSSVVVNLPDEYAGRIVEFLAVLENMEIVTDLPAKVVINEKTGTVVMNGRVAISPVAISHGNLTVEVSTKFQVSQPAPLSEAGQTVVTPDRDVTAYEDKASLVPVEGAELGTVIKALNALGVTPRDLIAILQALKASGALAADLEIM